MRLKAEQLGRVWPVGGGISPPAFQLRLDHHEHRRYHAALNAISPYVEVRASLISQRLGHTHTCFHGLPYG